MGVERGIPSLGLLLNAGCFVSGRHLTKRFMAGLPAEYGSIGPDSYCSKH
jgi:hypothetical protein